MKTKRRKRISKFDVIGNIIMIIIVFYCLVPLALLLISSLTDNECLVRNGYSFIPEAVSLSAYEYLVGSGKRYYAGIRYVLCSDRNWHDHQYLIDNVFSLCNFQIKSAGQKVFNVFCVFHNAF